MMGWTRPRVEVLRERSRSIAATQPKNLKKNGLTNIYYSTILSYSILYPKKKGGGGGRALRTFEILNPELNNKQSMRPGGFGTEHMPHGLNRQMLLVVFSVC